MCSLPPLALTTRCSTNLCSLSRKSSRKAAGFHGVASIRVRQRARYQNDDLAEYLIPVYADIIDVQTRMLPALDTTVNKLGIKGVDGYGEWPSGCGERSWLPASARRFPLA